MQKLIIVLSFVFIAASLSAQKADVNSDYKTAVGIKYYPAAITVKSFIKQNTAIEGLASFWNYGTRFTALYEIYHDINDIDGLKWYVGPGAHLGFWNNKWKDEYPTRDGGVQFGVDGIIGLDYKIKNAPVDVSLDWQPSFTFIGYNYFEGGWGGIGIRYAF
ncbi:MAG: hypothetical protein ABI405_06085 [Parafilimonas sp.]